MPARKHTQWLAKPSVDYVDSRIYSDQDIFDEEIEKIFKKVWIPLCHESEIPNELDYRNSSIANEQVLIVKGKENTHAFKHDYNLSVSGTGAGAAGITSASTSGTAINIDSSNHVIFQYPFFIV